MLLDQAVVQPPEFMVASSVILRRAFVQPPGIMGASSALLRRAAERSACLSPARLLKSTTATCKHSSDKLRLPNEQSMYNLGFMLGQDPKPKDVLLIHGQLGAGKTVLARGYIHAATEDSTLQVTSPTYLLTNTYPSSKSVNGVLPTIYHMDLWRLDDASSRPIVDFQNVFENHISLIEWPDRLKKLQPPERLDVFLEYIHGDTTEESPVDDPWGFGSGDIDDDTSTSAGRYVHFVPHGQLWTERLEQLRRRYDT